MTSITGAGPLKDLRLPYFDRKHATALKIKEIVDGVLSIPRGGYYEFDNVHVDDVMHMGNNQYSVSIVGNNGNGIIMDHELRLINKRLSTIGLTVDWIGAHDRFLRLFLDLKRRSGEACPCPPCVTGEEQKFQENNR